MGAPKQKWTAVEEGALKAGVVKYGAGKWRTILTDQEFGSILRLRSNVDLKDKWRNINVMISGIGSRNKSKLAVKKNQPNQKHHDNSQPDISDEVGDARSPADSAVPKEPIARLDKVILDSIRQLSEPGGSDKASIATCIEEKCHTEPDFKKKLTAKLKHLTSNGKLMKVNHKYKIAKRVASSEPRRSSPMFPSSEGRKQNSSAENGETGKRTRLMIDEELTKMKSVTPQEAAAAAARAVAAAEVAIEEAAKAAREAEEAEAEAEAAEIFAKAACKALKDKMLRTC